MPWYREGLMNGWNEFSGSECHVPTHSISGSECHVPTHSISGSECHIPTRRIRGSECHVPTHIGDRSVTFRHI